MLLNNCFHTDDKNHDHVPFSSKGFPYACIHTEMDQYSGRSIPWHWHTSMEIVNVIKGAIELKTQDQSFLLRAGDAAFVNTGVLHMYQAQGTEPAELYAHLFHMDFLSGADGSVFEEKYFLPVSRCTALQAWPVHPDTREHMEMVSAVLTAAELVQNEPEYYEMDTRNLLCRFWKGLLRETEEKRKAAPIRNTVDSERIKLMMDYVQDHYAETITVDDIAASAGVSSRECSRCFRRCIGASPIEHLTQYRVRMAAKALRETSQTVLEISENCGFSTPSYFSKIFRDLMKQTPKEYQKKHRMSGI